MSSVDRRPEDTQRGRKSGNNREQATRVPPHDFAAEESLLGAAMIATPALEVVATKVRPEDFYKPAHGHVADAMTAIFEREAALGALTSHASPADPVTLANELRRMGLLEAVGGPNVLLDLMVACPATSNAARYASIVHDLATLRRLIGAAGEIAELGYAYNAYSPSSIGDDVHAAVLKAQEEVARVASQNGARSYSSLEFGDVDLLLSGSIEKLEASFLGRSDGQALLYAGRMHLFHGEPTAGKSWLALTAAVEILAVGGAVAYLDYEDSFSGIVGRLLALGANPDDVRDRFLYVKQDGPFGSGEKVELGARLRALNPDLVVVDGVAEALSRDGLSEDRATEVVEWIEKLPRWLAKTGAAVVLLDHVAKDRETRGRWARGSSAKLAAIDGAAYEIEVLVPFSRHRAGKVKLKVAKDRPGSFELGSVAAVVTVTPHANGERVVLEIDPPEVASTADPWKPTVLMRKVSDELERAVSPMTARALRDVVRADKPKLVTEAIARLVAEGWVREYRIGSTKYLRLERPYREGAEAPPPDPELFEGLEKAFPGATVAEDDDVVVRGPWPQQEDPTDPGPREPDPDEGDQ